MLPEEAARQVDPIVAKGCRDSERQRNDELNARLAELERHGRIGSGLHRKEVLEAFERDLERRARAIEDALRRVLDLGLVGDSDAVGETLCAAFRHRFEEQARQIETKLPESGSLQGLSLGDFPQTLSAAICGELELAAREYVLRVRPPLPAIELLPEQEQLLMVLVEASRSVAPANKTAFHLFHSLGGPPRLLHPGLAGKPADAHTGDIEELAHKGLLRLSCTDRGKRAFDVSPEGFRYYQEIRRRQGAGLERVERFVRMILESQRFRELYPEAFERWAQAEALLWQSDVEAKLTTVGHTLREGIQCFATALVDRFPPPDVTKNPASDQARVKAVLALKKGLLGETTRKALEAQWATTSNLVQRLEHGAQREGAPLTWEDARRAVFLVAVAMVELDRATDPVPPT